MSTKPLGGKAYGSIGHLPRSRLGPGDWHIRIGQARILTEKPRKGDRIVVTEKLDGACMAVANVSGEIVALTRAGYRAVDGAFAHLRAFAPWAYERVGLFAGLLRPGERVAGEWLVLAHGTFYDVGNPAFEPFVAFDIFREGKRVLRDEFKDRCVRAGLPTAFCCHDAAAPCSIEAALVALGPRGNHGASELIEGAVWRVEREGRVDFLAKYVRPDKQDGKYLSEITGNPPIWHWPFEGAAA